MRSAMMRSGGATHEMRGKPNSGFWADDGGAMMATFSKWSRTQITIFEFDKVYVEGAD